MDLEHDDEDVGAIFIGVTWFAIIQAGICLYSDTLRFFKTIQTDVNAIVTRQQQSLFLSLL
jgi:hypothetical protein